MALRVLPKLRKMVKSGILRAPERVWPRHRAWLRRHHCVVTHCLQEPVEVSHIRTASNAGTGLRPHDASSVPMCGGPTGHHAEYHRRGHKTFEAKYRLELAAIAAEFTRFSPDLAMLESMKEPA